jgi:hypothetical protein
MTVSAPSCHASLPADLGLWDEKGLLAAAQLIRSSPPELVICWALAYYSVMENLDLVRSPSPATGQEAGPTTFRKTPMRSISSSTSSPG